MKERPILMSAPMVQAILAGKKTQTRRIIPASWLGQEDCEREYPYNLTIPNKDGDYNHAEDICKYGRKGDRLWVRETFWHGQFRIDHKHTNKPTTIYCADGKKYLFIEKWKPSIHMPRWASRITLEITNIRVEKIRDISVEDVFSEGCIISTDKDNINDFQNLWQSIYGEKSWNDNSWVWVIEFKRV